MKRLLLFPLIFLNVSAQYCPPRLDPIEQKFAYKDIDATNSHVWNNYKEALEKTKNAKKNRGKQSNHPRS